MFCRSKGIGEGFFPFKNGARQYSRNSGGFMTESFAARKPLASAMGIVL
jgi:hypothetical protein